MSILNEILERRRARVSVLKRERPYSSLETEPAGAEPRRSLSAALRRGPEEPVRFLCEIKRASPSAGWIRRDAAAGEIALRYGEAGASGISLVTEEEFFHGRLDDLPLVRGAGLPVLMKDFLVDPYQVALGKSLGADAVLLIAAVEDPVLLRDVRQAARDLGLEAVIEVHTLSEIDCALRLHPDLIGINNRDLSTFEVDLETSRRLFHRLPPEVVRLSESGIRRREDVVLLQECGFDACLVGEILMREEDPGSALRMLRGVDR